MPATETIGEMVDTRKVKGRREVSFASLDDLEADVEALVQAADEERLKALGNWSLGQALQHLQRFMTRSMEGFEKAPWFLPVMGLPFRLFMMKRVLGAPPPPGMKPGKVPFMPDDEADAATESRAVLGIIERVRSGERFTQRSPLLGQLTHEQWTKLHLRHAELHLSFFTFQDDPSEKTNQ
jgi:hypothetical protein